LGVDPARTHIVTYNVDGRLMLNQLLESHAGEYDLIIGDAFNDLSIPYHLTTREFDLGIQRLLTPDGFYLALVIDKLRGGKFIPAYTRTVMSVWPAAQVLADAEPWQSTSASTYVVAVGNTPVSPDRLAQVRGQGPDGRVVTHIMPGELMNQWLTEANASVL